MKKAIAAVVVAGLGFAACALEVTDVSARQRWPWNGLVDMVIFR